ncbi:MAG: DUF1501 domain-containing protein [Saprospiraceae bacterium]|nr:DUF1501 domain-containing protein [Saprospiraceae bacterium]
MFRRDFLKSGSLATAALMMPQFLKALETPGAMPVNGRKLVIIQLSGGNDGLNTIIPLRNDVYYRERPRLAIKPDKALRLTDEAGIHPTLSGLKSLWDDGAMAVLNSVGYPNPDRSHFRSMDIWHSGSPSDAYWETGWLGRYLDAHCAGRPAAGLELDDTLSLALKGENAKGLAFQDARRLHESTRSPYFSAYSAARGKSESDEAPVDYLYKTMAETLSSADYLFEQSKKRPSTVTYPATGLGKDLKTIASLILADTDTSVYYASLGSFDTHINQDGQQKRLFQELNDALLSFAADMKANGKWNEVLVVTFSEFGRRVAQNASGGTDHGTANCMLFLGGSLREKGLLNAMPDLGDLQDGDLKFFVDFRQVYATLLRQWLGADDQKILKNSFPTLSFL